MSDNLDARIERLRRRLAALTDPEERADQAAAIAALEAQRAPAAPRDHAMDISGESQTGVAVAGDVDGGVVAPLFPAGGSGNYIAGVINIYRQAGAPTQIDYGAALRRYLEHLYACHATIDLRGIDDRPMDMPLSEVYVSLNLHEPPPDDLRGRGGLRGFVEKLRRRGQLEPEPDELHMQGAVAPVSWPQALRHTRLAVVGAPGSGKTTLLHYTAVRLAEALARDDDTRLADLGIANAPPVPLLLPLRELGTYLQEAGRREASGANPRLLLDCLTNYYARFDLQLPADFFTRLCDANRAILLLDGLDEVTRSEDRVFVSAVVRSFATRYPRCRYVVTARIAAYHGDAQIGLGFRICTVADLDATQQQHFIGNWSRSLHRLLYRLHGDALEHQSHRYADDLWRALQMNDRVRDLATNPLLLTVVAVIFYNNYVLPEDRAALYEECVEVLLRGGRGKADRAGQERAGYTGQATLSMGMAPKRELLSAVAYTMHQRGEERLFISRSELIDLFTQQLSGRSSEPRETARIVVEELPVHIGLLDEREPDRYRFSHLSFQEFLAARFIASATEDRWDELLAHYDDSWWREVILLCAGHLSQEQCWLFLRKLMACGDTTLERSLALALAADALAELERFKGQGPIRTEVRDAALALFQLPAGDAPAAARVRCGRVLAQLGDPRPGVCDLPPAIIPFAGGAFVIGSTPEQAEDAGRAYERYFLDKGDKETAQSARTWPQDEINDQPSTVGPFDLACYPVTNAQYALFLADDGYNPSRPWWDDAGQAWLARDDATIEGLKDWQRRKRKDQPGWWDHPRVGQTRTNHPVVGISWYEAVAFCRWLSQHPVYNPQRYTYRLPTEAEWEYAARGMARRIYPWGKEAPDGERANFDQIYDGTSAVGCFPLGTTAENVHDLAGNVWEWTGSVYAPYPYDPADGREQLDNPAEKYFTLRGGGWLNPSITLRASLRDHRPARQPQQRCWFSTCPAPSPVKHFVGVLCSVPA
jgi:formylglycine-generating enzyme required for sulfatase activity